jgi:23S rRNA pseudouridine2605 synthase
LKKTSASTRLARALSKCGHCSRSRARDLIASGRVRVNDRVALNADKPVAFGKDLIEVDGQEVRTAVKVYLMLNKPRGIITSADDEKGRPTVYSLLPGDLPWVAPVGRLDKASEGLLLLTNDSAWGARIASPESHVSKTYHVQVAAVVGPELLRQLTSGLGYGRGDVLRAKQASVVRTGAKNSWLEIALDEGRNRHIRRLMDGFGIEVLRLIRVAIGPLQLGSLPKGKVRELTAEEVATLAGRQDAARQRA